MGCAGADFVRTPNIDRLAKAGGAFYPMHDKLSCLRAFAHCTGFWDAALAPRLRWEQLLLASQPTDLLPAIARLQLLRGLCG